MFRGKAKDGLKQYEEAITDFNKAIECFYTDTIGKAVAYYDRGKAKNALKQYEGAIEDFNKAIERFYTDTGKVVAYYNRGKAKDGLKQYEEAIEDFSEAIKLDPKFTDASYERNIIFEKLKNEKLKVNLKIAFWCAVVFISLLFLLFK